MAALKLLCANFQLFPLQKSRFKKIETSKHISEILRLKNQWRRFVYVYLIFSRARQVSPGVAPYVWARESSPSK